MESRRERHIAPRHDQAVAPTRSTDASCVSREQFCQYLAAAREESGKTLGEIAGVTRIPLRSLECLERGEFEKLPADVFVRGFLRSYARCVGLDVDETIRRYAACGMTPAPVSSPMAEELARKLDGSLASLHAGSPSYRTSRATTHASQPGWSTAPAAGAQARNSAGDEASDHLPVAAQVVSTEPGQGARPEPGHVAAGQVQTLIGATGLATGTPATGIATGTRSASVNEPAKAVEDQGARSGSPSHKRRKRNKKKRRGREAESDVQAAHAALSPAFRSNDSSGTSLRAVVEERSPVEQSAAVTITRGAEDAREESAQAAARSDAGRDNHLETAAPGEAAQPMPDQTEQGMAAASGAGDLQGEAARTVVPPRPVLVPVLVIDDDRPEDAERIIEARAAVRERDDATWRNFLPPALLDSEEGSRRGALTLAVIILVIVATLTMSYLMRRPNESGDGVTWRMQSPGQAGQPEALAASEHGVGASGSGGLAS